MSDCGCELGRREGEGVSCEFGRKEGEGVS